VAPDFVGVASIANREKQPHFFLTFSGFTTPGTIAHYDFTAPETQHLSILRTTKVNGLNLDNFQSTQVWYESKDGTKVPMFIVRHKSTKCDGTAAAIQYGDLISLFIPTSMKEISNNFFALHVRLWWFRDFGESIL
jgi:prolyl oligopeptidase